MHPYLQILVRVETDGSLHALGAFSTKDKLKAYQKAKGLKDEQVRLDYNGPFDEELEAVYAGHRRWNMDRFQLGGYFNNEGRCLELVTQEGYVSVLRIDITHAQEQALERDALELYNRLQKRWRLASYEELIAREGLEKRAPTSPAFLRGRPRILPPQDLPRPPRILRHGAAAPRAALRDPVLR